MKQSTGNSMLSLYRLCDGQAEAMEFRATEDTYCLGVPFKDVRLRSNLLIACVTRNGEVIIPKGDDCIRVGDSVVIVTTADQSLSTLNDIFKPEAVIG